MTTCDEATNLNKRNLGIVPRATATAGPQLPASR